MGNSDEALLESNSELLKAMAHPVRLCILRQLANEPTSCVSNLSCCMNASQSSVSQHLAKLREMGLVKYHREGNMLYYSVDNDKIRSLIDILFREEGDS